MADEREKDMLRLILCALFPPLAVFTQVGFSWSFAINIVLTLLAYVPGLIHAVYVVLKYGEDGEKNV